MRDIKLKGKVYKTTRQNVDALAWATNRRGRNAWVNEYGVLAQILEYIREHDVEYDWAQGTRSLRNTVDRLVKEGYADISQQPNGMITKFKFKDDVNLNGHTPRMRELTVPEASDPVAAYHTSSTINPRAVDVPLPPLPKPERYLGEDVNKKLDVWAERDPESYAKWAEDVVQRLEALYG